MEIYCDESRPEAFARAQNRNMDINQDKYMLIGGVWLPDEDRERFKKLIKKLKKKHDVNGEIKWKNVSPSKLEFYLELIDLFFDNYSIRFRCIVVDSRKVNFEKYHNNDNELGFYKFYYQLLLHWLEPGSNYKIFLDYKRNKDMDRLPALKRSLIRNSSAYIENVQAIDSNNSLLIQVADVLIGAVGYQFHGYCTSESKLSVISRVESYIGHPIQGTYQSERKFNIFEINLL
ncbi:DUF3800 domain-containing protein [Sutcliffiella halmapala]|uniref:DUF3800 domain-containing protein n=1 Tax=Sutcliffiella halmapala TaxID=79882 RepID=UPI00147665A3|nr:DUF3800 domain-containing protein [Sutcliffiella halmapala]